MFWNRFLVSFELFLFKDNVCHKKSWIEIQRMANIFNEMIMLREIETKEHKKPEHSN